MLDALGLDVRPAGVDKATGKTGLSDKAAPTGDESRSDTIAKANHVGYETLHNAHTLLVSFSAACNPWLTSLLASASQSRPPRARSTTIA